VTGIRASEERAPNDGEAGMKAGDGVDGRDQVGLGGAEVMLAVERFGRAPSRFGGTSSRG
jgi:hypothetical protein